MTWREIRWIMARFAAYSISLTGPDPRRREKQTADFWTRFGWGSRQDYATGSKDDEASVSGASRGNEIAG